MSISSTGDFETRGTWKFQDSLIINAHPNSFCKALKRLLFAREETRPFFKVGLGPSKQNTVRNGRCFVVRARGLEPRTFTMSM